MSGDTADKKPFSRSDGVDLLKHIEDVFRERNERYEDHFKAIEKEMNARFREAEKDIATALVAVEKQSVATDKAVDKAAEALREKLDAMMEKSMERFPTRKDFDPVKADVASLLLTRGEVEGKASQKSVNISLAFNLLNAIATIIGLIIVFANLVGK